MGRPAVPRRAARRPPLILVLDDIHWAEPSFLDLVDQLTDWSRDAPILVICMARPELLESSPGWGGGKLHATTVALEPLSGDEVAHLVENFLAGGDSTSRSAAGSRSGRWQSAVRRRDPGDARRRRPAAPRGRAVGVERGSGPVRGSPDDPGAPGSTPGSSGRRRPSAAGSRIDRRSLLLPRGAARADAGAGTGRGRGVVSGSCCGAT